MVEYEVLTKENLEDKMSQLFNDFIHGSFEERKILSNITNKFITYFSNETKLPGNVFYLRKNMKWVVYEGDEVKSKVAEYESEALLKDDYKGAIYARSSKYSFTHFTYNKDLDVIIGKNYFLYENNEKLNVTPESSVLIITRTKTFYALNFNSPWAAIAKNCSMHEFPDVNVEGTSPSNLVETFKEMFGQTIFGIGANKFFTIENITSLNNLLKVKIKSDVKTGPKQEKIDELTAIKLPKIDVIIPDEFRTGGERPYTKTFIQSYGKGKAVIRWLMKNKITGDCLEGFRVYIEGKDLYPCKNNNDGKFVYTTISNFSMDNFVSCEMADFNEKDCDGTILSYYSSIVKSIPSKYRSLIIFMFIKNQKIEQLFKMGLEDYFYELLGKNTYELAKAFEKDFNVQYPKEKNIFKYIGLNKYQLEKTKIILKKDVVKALLIVKLGKLVFGNFMDIDNKTSDLFYDAASANSTDKLKELFSYCQQRLADVAFFARCEKGDVRKNFCNSFIKVMQMKSSRRRMHTDYYMYFFDFLTMVHLTEDVKISIKIENEEELINKHDNMVALTRLIKNKLKYKAFRQNAKKLERITFEDEKYCVITPDDANDLIREGNELHHCVASYVDRVAEGTTNILFIRKQSDKKKPFFTVEVSNSKVIMQVHGFANRNANTEPGLVEFLKKWIKEKRLTIDNYNQVR